MLTRYVVLLHPQSFCHQHNSHLVHVNDEQENNFIKDRLRELTGMVINDYKIQ